MKNKKRLIYIISGLLIVLLIVFAIGKKKGWIGKADEEKVAVEKVMKRTIVETVSANGKITPETEVKLSPDVSGEIVELYVKEGDQIKAGTLLAKINPEIYRSNYDQSVAALNTQQANLANSKARLVQVKSQFVNTKATFERNQKLHDQKAIADQEFENSRSAFEVAQAEVEAAEETVRGAAFNVKSAEAGVKSSSENLYKTSIYAPVSGTISKLNVEKGERVAGASQFSSGTEIVRIANLQIMEVNVEVNENDIVRISLNDTALVEVDAYRNRKFKGVVTEISTSANTTGTSADQVTNFDVKIRILPESYQDLIKEDKPNESPFRPGMSATVDIQTEATYDILAIPIQSVTTRVDSATQSKQKIDKIEKAQRTKKTEAESDENAEQKKNEETEEVVFLVVNGKAKQVKVKTGIQDNMYIQILEGLKEGDEVIVAPYRSISKSLKDEAKVKVVKKEELYKDEK